MSEIYQFPATTTYRRSGPGVEPMSRITKMVDSRILLDKNWVNFIFSINNFDSKACSKIVAKDYGPSKGYNSNGLLIYNSLVYPGRNVVVVERVVKGLDGQNWGIVNGIPMTSVPAPFIYSYYNHPHLIHKLYGVSTKGTFFELDNPTYAPILGTTWFLPMKVLKKIIYPKAVTIATNSLRIRSLPRLGDNVVAGATYGQTLFVTELFLGSGGIWGKTNLGWISLRYLGQNFTSWKI